MERMDECNLCFSKLEMHVIYSHGPWSKISCIVVHVNFFKKEILCIVLWSCPSEYVVIFEDAKLRGMDKSQRV